MNKPNNYENVSTGEFTPITAGGHHMIIKQVREQESKSGKPMLVIAFDFAPNDSQPGYMNQLFKDDIRPDKKWPYAGTVYVVSVDKDGQCSRNFKSFITAFENSNGVKVNWCDGPQFVAQFAGKRIGGVFGYMEEEYKGVRRNRCLHRWFCEDSKVESAKVPEPRKLPDAPAPDPSGFAQVDMTDESLPF